MTMNDLRILEFMAESLHEWIILQSSKNSRIFDRRPISIQPRVFLRNGEAKKSFQRYLALFRDKLDSKVKCKESILEVLFVQYLPESNCGFVEFLCLQYGENQDEMHSLNCGWRKKLMKEAEGVLNKEAERYGFETVHEIFYLAAAVLNPTTRCFIRCLYNVGFRLVKTENVNWRQLSRNNFSHLFVYISPLASYLQGGKRPLPGQIKLGTVVKFLKELSASNQNSKNDLDAHNVEEVLVLIESLDTAMKEVFVKSSFPWHGSTASCPDNQVAVVGGGVAGLAAAASLSEAGFDVVLLEAADYFGGRVKQAQPFKGFAPVDLGGEVIHGSDTIINRIARENGWPLEPCIGCDEMETEEMIYYKGRLIPLHSDHPDIRKAYKARGEIDLWQNETEDDIPQNPVTLEQKSNTLLSNARVVEEREADSNPAKDLANEAVADLGGAQGAEKRDMSALEWLKGRECDEDAIDVFDTIHCQDYACAPSQMGMRESCREENAWDYGSGDYRLTGSYSQLVEYLLHKCIKVDMRLNWQVKEVEWKENVGQIPDGKNVRTVQAIPGETIVLKNQNGEMLTARYVVITVPLTILKDGDIDFIPALPENKKKAIDSIHMGGALKIVCRFKSQFWSDKVNLIYCVRGFVGQIWMYTRDSFDSDEKCHVIVGFQTAEPAEQKMNLSEKDVLDGFLQQLDEIFGTESQPYPAKDQLMDYVYYHWSKHPFIRGAYSSPTVHTQGMRHVLASSVQDLLFFAGEATNVTACACVHTAMETGIRAANEICRVAKRVQLESKQT